MKRSTKLNIGFVVFTALNNAMLDYFGWLFFLDCNIKHPLGLIVLQLFGSITLYYGVKYFSQLNKRPSHVPYISHCKLDPIKPCCMERGDFKSCVFAKQLHKDGLKKEDCENWAPTPKGRK